ncbi:MAG: DUF1295 domain-containing protein [Clostridiales bacterium]|nr:DUF1295 domain-containing protein [Clostridiales bacterium]
MLWFLIMLGVALVISAIGFYKYVYFISLGYGFSVAAIAVTSLIAFRENLSAATIIFCILFVVYGLRLSGYLLIREVVSSSYRNKMKTEIKDGKSMKFIAKFFIWITCALLYACQTAPLYFRLYNDAETNVSLLIGMSIMFIGILIESIADIQKNAAKKKAPDRFVSSGLYRLVRCPNYLGEMLFWTGVIVSAIGALTDVLSWVIAISGYLGIIYVMFSGARRLELRQNRTYGQDPEYQAYVKKTPIMVSFIPLYSVASQKWLVG